MIGLGFIIASISISLFLLYIYKHYFLSKKRLKTLKNDELYDEESQSEQFNNIYDSYIQQSNAHILYNHDLRQRIHPVDISKVPRPPPAVKPTTVTNPYQQQQQVYRQTSITDISHISDETSLPTPKKVADITPKEQKPVLAVGGLIGSDPLISVKFYTNIDPHANDGSLSSATTALTTNTLTSSRNIPTRRPDETYLIKREDIILERSIGTGGFGQVWKGRSSLLLYICLYYLNILIYSYTLYANIHYILIYTIFTSTAFTLIFIHSIYTTHYIFIYTKLLLLVFALYKL